MNRVWEWIKKYKKTTGVAIVLFIAFLFCLPDPLFDNPYSTVLEDKDGRLLSASIASDGQWRFPAQTYVPKKFEAAILLFEDKRFFSHLGVDPLATFRAIQQNIKAGTIVSGGSTLTMQVIRLSRQNHRRTYFEKIIEMILATRLELSYSKEEILSLYASHAPFGGNVVGIEAASWRYFGRELDDLSWAESAMLAVLPNNPSLIHPGKNRNILKEKRNRLLNRLKEEGKLDEMTLELAKAEAIPQKPLALPRQAKHLLARAAQEGHQQTRIKSSIDNAIQLQTERILNEHQLRLSGNQVFNAAAIILKVETGEVLAYVGNTDAGREHSEMVDVVNAPRSTGSILKPFLFAALMDDGKILPQTLIPDVPTLIGGFSPKNFSKDYDGAVPADKALIRSLNIPAVHELRDFRYEKFYEVLKNVGITTLTQPADHYGLSLVLGGAEGTLWDITGAYASMARTLNNYFGVVGAKRYDKNDFHPATYLKVAEMKKEEQQLTETSWLDASGIWITFEALKELYRPGEETGWRYFNSTKPIAWKTGTSFGFRDGWAVGTNPEYTVGVWVGNADGEGRPGLTGTEMAAPILFDLFSLLPGQPWFQQPASEMRQIKVCAISGQRVSSNCESTNSIWVTSKGLQTQPCEYHKKIHLTKDEKFQVNLNCEKAERIHSVNWFVLPPVQEYYFRTKNLSYKPLPPIRSDCGGGARLVAMDLVYPKPGASIFIPRELDGSQGLVLFQAAHRSSSSTIYWHLDGEYIGSTKKTHHLSLSAASGVHSLTLVDDDGEILTQSFIILSDP
ncbi:MAG TPA: penicillin-binding protein 1C [Cyclobacteriaceae bacterium]|nr:penicillin-binding protein 1C [Cyclobacteriaceae bacterium]